MFCKNFVNKNSSLKHCSKKFRLPTTSCRKIFNFGKLLTFSPFFYFALEVFMTKHLTL